MKIQLAGVEYLTVGALVEALKGSTDDKPLLLDCQSFTEDDDFALIMAIHQASLSIKPLIQVSGLTHLTACNARLVDLHLSKQREQFGIDHAEEMKAGLSMAPYQRKFYRAQPLKIAVQQQKQQQKQQQQKTPVKKRQRIVSTQLETVSAPSGAVDAEVHDEFVNKRMLGKEHPVGRQLNDYLDACHPGHAIRLEEIWDRVIGEGGECNHARGGPIAQIQREAMEQIIRHYSEFSYGLVIDNLPAGFQVQATADGKKTLCFNPTWVNQPTPFTLVLKEPSFMRGTFPPSEVERLRTCRDPAVFKALLRSKQQNVTGVEKSSYTKDHFLMLLSAMDKPNDDIIQKITGWLDASMGPSQYLALMDVFEQTGDVGVFLLLQNLQLLKQNGAFEPFINGFLQPGAQALMTPHGLSNIQRLSKLSYSELLWWKSLVKQHHQSGARVDFNELFDAWHAFLSALSTMGLSIKSMRACPFKNISHMKVALDRALYLLHQATDKEEQLACLDHLDFGPHGAYAASRYYDYHLVSQEMRLTPKHAMVQGASSPSEAIFTYATAKNRAIEIKTEASEFYYRYIGEQTHAFLLNTYQRMEKYIDADEKLEKHRALLLYLVVLTTSGPRADKQLTDPVVTLSSCLTALLSALDKEEGLGTLLQAVCLTFSTMNPEEIPALNELENLVILLDKQSLLSAESLSNKLTKALTVMRYYGDVMTRFIKNIHEQVQIEENKTTDIKANDVYAQICWLYDHEAELHQLFKNEPENLKNWIQLISLTHLQWPNDHPKLLAMLNQFMSLNLQNRSILLAQLSTIHLKMSQKMPALEDLSEIISQQKMLCMEYGGAPLDQDYLNKIEEIIRNQLPLVKMGQEAAKESSLDLVGLIKDAYLDWDIITPLDEFVDKELAELLKLLPLGSSLIEKTLKNSLRSLKNANGAFHQATKERPIDEARVIQTLVQIEQAIQSLLQSLPIPLSLLKKGLSAVIEPADFERYSEFLTTPRLSIFLNESMQRWMDGALNQALKELNMKSSVFHGWVKNQLGPVNQIQPMDEVIAVYKKNYEKVTAFINALVRMRNREELDYRHGLDVLMDPKHTSLLEVSVQTRMLSLVAQQNQIPMQEQLSGFFAAMKTHEPSLQHVTRALDAMALLGAHQDQLGPLSTRSLFHLSLNHHLTKNTPFPLKDMIALKTTQDTHDPHAGALFDAMIQVINGATSEQNAVESIQKTIDVLRAHSGTSAWVLLLLKKCTPPSLQVLDDYRKLLLKIPVEPEAKEQWIRIMTILGQQGASLATLLKVNERVMHHPELWADMATLFMTRPYPTSDVILRQLADEKSPAAFKAYLAHYDLDPQGVRTDPEVLEAQFSTHTVPRVVLGMKDLLNDESFDEAQSFEFIQEFMAVNAMGRSLTQTSRLALKQAFKQGVQSLQAPGLEAFHVRQLKLKLVALMRENFFRSTGKFPNSTQMISLMVSMDFPGNGLLQLNTGEGKSIVTAMLAVMQWSEGRGCVNVCSKNEGLVNQDYEEKGIGHFFESLDIASAVIEADSPAGTFCIQGINYAPAAALSLYLSRGRLEGEPLGLMDLILDESDASILDDQTQFNLSMRMDESTDSYAWLYPLINAFIDQPAWDTRDYLYQLRTHLEQASLSAEQQRQLMMLSDSKLDLWLASACKARDLVLDVEYIIEKIGVDEAGKAIAVATPVNITPQSGTTFMEGIQQFLHARLQKMHPDKVFPIEDEMVCVSTESMNGFINRHRRVTGVTATAGARHELIEQDALFGMVAVSIPPHKKNKREVFETRVVKPKAYHQALIEQLSSIKKTKEGVPPVLLVSQGIPEAKALYQALNEKFPGRVVLVTTEEQRQPHLSQLGMPGTITVSTPILARGIDIVPKHPQGLFVIQTYLDTLRNTLQIMGRSARDGKVGKYLAIYEEEGELLSSGWNYLFGKSRQDREKVIKKMQMQRQEQSAVHRHVVQSVDRANQVVFKQFDDWTALLMKITPDMQRDALRQTLLQRRQQLIADLDAQWMRQRPDSLNTKALSDAYMAYEQKDVPRLWEACREHLVLIKSKVSAIHPLDALRAKYMESIQIAEVLTGKKIERREIKKTKVSDKKQGARRIDYAMDEAAALLHYSKDSLSLSEKERLQAQSSITQCQILVGVFNQQVHALKSQGSRKNKHFFKPFVMDTKTDVLTNMSRLITALGKCDQLSSTDRWIMQPAIADCVYLAQSLPLKADTMHAVTALKKTFMNDLSHHLAADLIKNLSWVERGGVDALIERGRVKEAARELLALAKAMMDPSLTDKSAVTKKLVHALYKHQAQLENLWLYYSLGHQDIRTVIKRSLKQMGDVARVEGFDPLIEKQCRDKVACGRYLRIFNTLRKKMNVAYSSDTTWASINAQLTAMQDDLNDSLNVMDMRYYLKKQAALLPVTSVLHPPIQQLMKQLSKDIQTIDSENPALLINHRYLSSKAKQIKSNLERSVGAGLIHSLTIQHGHAIDATGAIELVVHGDAGLHGMDYFAAYDSPSTRNALHEELAKLQELMREVRSVQSWSVDNSRSAIKMTPMKNLPLKAHLLNQVGLWHRAQDELNAQEQALDGLVQASNAPSDGFLTRAWRYYVDDITGQINAKREEIKALKEQKIVLEDQFGAFKRQFFDEVLNEKMALSEGTLDHKLDVLQAQIKFVEDKIAEEQGKGNVMIRRFDDVDALLAYEDRLKNGPMESRPSNVHASLKFS
jgi:hypothetical protein